MMLGIWCVGKHTLQSAKRMLDTNIEIPRGCVVPAGNALGVLTHLDAPNKSKCTTVKKYLKVQIIILSQGIIFDKDISVELGLV